MSQKKQIEPVSSQHEVKPDPVMKHEQIEQDTLVLKRQWYGGSKAQYEWTINNFNSRLSQTNSQVMSSIFMVGSSNWRLIAQTARKQSMFDFDGSFLSLYLECVPDSLDGSEGITQAKLKWTKFAYFSLTLVNNVTFPESIQYETEKRFTWHKGDNIYGFPRFLPLDDLSNGFLTDSGSIRIRLTIQVCNDPHLTIPFVYNSRAETGFTGIENQGATCYMNSFLQTLYHLSQFTRDVYKIPTMNDSFSVKESIPFALQRVFWRLQYQNDPIDTMSLTKSFGWTSADAFIQHDIQEFARILLETLENKMAENEQTKGAIARLLEGKLLNYIQCINVDYTSKRSETFYDIQLDVSGCKDIYESFDKYTTPEMLTGDNKYQAEGHGLQDAKKGVIFEALPPVLMLHLKRFQWDYRTCNMYKIYDHFEFPEELDLNKYMAEGSAQDNKFKLFSVLVHSGSVNSGHYWAYVKPHADSNQWFKFDDDRVYKVSEKEAILDNFGGHEPDSKITTSLKAKKKRKQQQDGTNNAGGDDTEEDIRPRKYHSAYMLVYIKESEISRILKKIDDKEVPAYLMRQFREELAEAEKQEEEEVMKTFAAIQRTAQYEPERVLKLLAYNQQNAYQRHSRDQNSMLLKYAVLSGDESLVKLLLDYSADPDFSRDRNEWRPLHYACQKGFAPIVSLLLKHGADTTVVTKDTKFTPLHLAVAGNHAAIVQMLLEKNKSAALVHAKDTKNKTPLDYALEAYDAQMGAPAAGGKLTAASLAAQKRKEQQLPSDLLTIISTLSERQYAALLEALMQADFGGVVMAISKIDAANKSKKRIHINEDDVLKALTFTDNNILQVLLKRKIVSIEALFSKLSSTAATAAASSNGGNEAAVVRSTVSAAKFVINLCDNLEDIERLKAPPAAAGGSGTSGGSGSKKQKARDKSKQQQQQQQQDQPQQQSANNSSKCNSKNNWDEVWRLLEQKKKDLRNRKQKELDAAMRALNITDGKNNNNSKQQKGGSNNNNKKQK